MLGEAISNESKVSAYTARKANMSLSYRLQFSGRAFLQEKELERRTEIVNATWKVCYTETKDGYGMGQQYGTDSVEIRTYEQFLRYLRAYTEDAENLGVRTDITNAQCPESLDDVAAAITEEYFEENVLIFMHHYDVKDTVPVITKIDYDNDAFWLNPYLIYVDCADGNEKGNMATYVILITIPKDQYHEFPENYEDLYYHNICQNTGSVLNGEPYVK